jgi:hypothetical protein
VSGSDTTARRFFVKALQTGKFPESVGLARLR